MTGIPRCDRYRARLDEHLAGLPDDRARRAFCDREYDRWQRLYRDFEMGVATYEPDVTASDFFITLCDISTRQVKYGPVAA
jgi:hypothetical protein